MMRHYLSGIKVNNKRTSAIVFKFLFFKQRHVKQLPLHVSASQPPYQPILSSPIHSEKKQRRKSGYLDNLAASLALNFSDADLESRKADKSALLEMSKDHIIEHAARRVDLFFYSLITYYRTDKFADRSTTFLQHGRGRNAATGENITQACHSSLFGAFNDDEINQTHFVNSLNATMELPAFVNKLDDELENACGCREKGLKIIQRVSRGHIDPIEGMSLFFNMMETAFREIESKRKLSKHGKPLLLRAMPEGPSSVIQSTIELQKKGTFQHCWNKNTRALTDDYLHLILNLSKSEKERCFSDMIFRKQCYAEKIAALQNELRQPCASTQLAPSA